MYSFSSCAAGHSEAPSKPRPAEILTGSRFARPLVHFFIPYPLRLLVNAPNTVMTVRRHPPSSGQVEYDSSKEVGQIPADSLQW
jgi:hypothetical protein